MTQLTSLCIIFISLVAALLLDTMFHNGFAPMVFTLLYWLASGFGITVWIKRWRAGNSPTPFVLVWLGLIPLLSSWMIVRASDGLFASNFLVCGAYIVLAWTLLAQRSTPQLSLLTPVQFWLQVLTKPFSPFTRLFAAAPERYQQVLGWAKALLLALPVVGLVVVLLANADLVIHEYSLRLLQWFGISDLAQLATHLPIVIYLVGGAAFLQGLLRAKTKPLTHQPWVANQERIAQLTAGLLLLILGVFSIIQLKFLFGGHELVEQLGLTYRDYAREGFMQLLLVALIVAAVLLALGKQTRLQRGLALVLTIETWLVLGAALKRVTVYIDQFHWASLRLFAVAGMLLLAALLGLFVVYVCVPRFSRRLLEALTVTSIGVALLLLNLFNPDYNIAKWNVEAYVAGAEEYDFDFDYSSFVSADGVDFGLQLFDAARTEQERQRAAQALDSGYRQLRRFGFIESDLITTAEGLVVSVEPHQHKNRVLYFHLSRRRALTLLEPRIAEIQAVAKQPIVQE